VTFNVDNTPPTAVLTGPQGGAFLTGGATASFVATDANVATATLAIGTQSFDVKSKTSQAVDTTALADGAYTLTLTVTDQAGNAAMSAGLINCLVIGLIAAAIVGFLAGFLIGRRRGPKEPERTSASEPPNPPGDEL